MSVVKVILRKKPKADGTCPLALRITKDRKSSYVYLGYHLLESDWDAVKQRVRKNHVNSVRLNNMIAKKLAEASDTAIEMDTNHAGASSKAVVKKIKPNSGASFIKQSEAYLAILKEAGKYNQYNADKPRINHFKDFLKCSDIVFPDITVDLLERFKHYLRVTIKVGKSDKKISERTVINHMVVIRSVFSQAIKQGAVDKKYYPFGKEGMTIKFPETMKVGLSYEDVAKIETVQLDNPNYNHARNLWLVSYYFGGMRVSDVLRLKWSDFKDDQLHYTMGKNKKPGKLKTSDKVVLILDQYKEAKRHKDDFIFPELKKIEDLNDQFLIERKIGENASRIDKFLNKHVAPLAKVEHKVTMHIARHTIGNLAGDKIPITMLQKIFRHSRVTTTIAYMNSFINKDADDALAAIIGS
ncbi:phage integrase SAM-like domain-containing protein [Mucilaginibacter terrae]|uniref:phage integrase SAM-like domain-containing protein n=1 Tax=Mucilaginibacter terrae TaxID=1955052 RepID=UPI003636B1C8